MTGPVATLTRYGPRETARRRLLCFPFAGGGTAAFRGWPDQFPDDVEVLSVQIPGRESRRSEPPLDDIESMAASVTPLLDDLTDLPYAIFGHSMGALVAYEVTLWAEAKERGPDCLFVSARRAPDEPHSGQRIADLPDEPFLDALQDRYGGVPEAVRAEPDLLALFLPAVRADVRAFETYVSAPGRQVSCPLRAYGGAEDPHPHPDELAGWERAGRSSFSTRVFPGGHFYLAAQLASLCADMDTQWLEFIAPPTSS